MGPQAKLLSVSFWLLCLCSTALAAVHHLSCFQLISPWAEPGLPKHLNVMKVNDLVLSTYNSDTGKLARHNGYPFRSESRAWYRAWDSWVQNEYQGLVQEMNTSSLRADSYYLQILKSCELDDSTGAVRATTTYSLNGEDVLQYEADQNHWFSVYPAASRVAERWNHEGEISAIMKVHTLQHCRLLIERTAPITTQKTAKPAAHVAFIPGTKDQLPRLVCQVTGFYPRDIEVTWERGGEAAESEHITSGIRPNGDSTFQIQVSIEVAREGVGPVEHACVVRHSSLGAVPLRVAWDSQATGPVLVPVIIAGCILAVLGAGAVAVGVFLKRRQGDQKGLYCPAQTQPGSLSSASGGTSSMASSHQDATE